MKATLHLQSTSHAVVDLIYDGYSHPLLIIRDKIASDAQSSTLRCPFCLTYAAS